MKTSLLVVVVAGLVSSTPHGGQGGLGGHGAHGGQGGHGGRPIWEQLGRTFIRRSQHTPIFPRFGGTNGRPKVVFFTRSRGGFRDTSQESNEFQFLGDLKGGHSGKFDLSSSGSHNSFSTFNRVSSQTPQSFENNRFSGGFEQRHPGHGNSGSQNQNHVQNSPVNFHNPTPQGGRFSGDFGEQFLPRPQTPLNNFATPSIPSQGTHHNFAGQDNFRSPDNTGDDFSSIINGQLTLPDSPFQSPPAPVQANIQNTNDVIRNRGTFISELPDFQFPSNNPAPSHTRGSAVDHPHPSNTGGSNANTRFQPYIGRPKVSGLITLGKNSEKIFGNVRDYRSGRH